MLICGDGLKRACAESCRRLLFPVSQKLIKIFVMHIPNSKLCNINTLIIWKPSKQFLISEMPEQSFCKARWNPCWNCWWVVRKYLKDTLMSQPQLVPTHVLGSGRLSVPRSYSHTSGVAWNQNCYWTKPWPLLHLAQIMLTWINLSIKMDSNW